MSREHKKILYNSKLHKTFFISVSTITGCLSIYAFAFLFAVIIGSMSSAIELKTCVVAAFIKKYKSVLRKRKRNMTK